MSLDPGQLAAQVLSAMKGVLVAQWPAAVALASNQAQKLVLTLVDIEQMVQAQQIDAETAADLWDAQRDATQAVLECIEGVDEIIAAQAINAGLAVVAQAVNAAVKFPLL